MNDLDRAPLNAAKNVYFENAIAYSNHSPHYIRFYLQTKSRDYFERKTYNNRAGISAADKAELDKAVSCPLIRVIRLADLMCQEDRHIGIPCDNVAPGAPNYADLITDLDDRKACIAERFGDFRAIMFQPTDPETGHRSN